MKRIYKKIISIVLIIISLLTLSSCIRFKINYSFDYGDLLKKATDFFAKKDNGEFSSTTSEITTKDEKNTKSKIHESVIPLSKYQLPNVGDVIGGFKATSMFDYRERNAKVVVFEHIKTGATCLLISNDDVDKSATFGFNTLAYDDKGLPHVFEHAALAGSKNYNNSNLFFEMVNKTYDTYLNALTMQQSTVYPMGSLSDEQLFSYFKFYIDGVFYPSVLENERILDSEAYRYVLNDKDSNIDMSGIVYSEMAANESNIYAAAHYNTVTTLYPDSFVSFETGGKTSDIPKITLDDLKKFHDKYYHPSNMVMTLYGDIDYKKYLEYADSEYLSNYEKKSIDKNDRLYREIDKYAERTYDFPVSSASDIDNKSVITYALACDGISAYEAGVFSLIIQDLSSDAGCIRTLLNEKLPKANFYIESYLHQEKPYIEFVFDNVNEEDKDIVKEIIEKSFEEEIKYEFDEMTLNSFADIIEMDIELERDSHGFTDYIGDFYEKTFRDNGKDLLGFFEYNKGVADIEEKYNDGTVNKLMDKYLSGNGKSVLVVTKPKRGLLEKNADDRASYLKTMKDNMTDDEISSLIDRTEAYNEWVEDNNKYTLIDKVRVASLSSLEEYKPKCYAYEENVEGVRFIRSDIKDIKYNYINILLDVSSVSYEDTLKLKLLSELLLYMPTTHYPDFELSNEYSLYAYNYGASLMNNVYRNGGYNPYFSFQVMSLDKHIDNIFLLIDETLFETKFDDVEKLKSYVSKAYTDMVTGFNSDPSAYTSTLIAAITNNDYLYNLHINGIDYMNFLHDIMLMDDNEIKELLMDCENLYEEIRDKNGMVCEIISNFDMMSTIKAKVLNLSYKFNHTRKEKIDYNLSNKYTGNVAIGCDTSVQYNYVVMPLKNNEIDFTSKYYVFNNMINSKILYPEFRVKRSCYGADATAGLDNIYISTYRDPNLKETYDVYDSLIDTIKDIHIDEEELEDYKINAYSSFSCPLTKFGEASIAIDEIFAKWDEKRPERYVRYMREIKETSLKDIEELKSIYIKLISEGQRVAAGSMAKINEAGEMFDEIITDYINRDK